MNNSNKRKNRGPTSGHPSNRPSNRMRGTIDQKTFNEGVYANHRLTHAATSLIGCVVEVHVKNGGIYQGIFKTFSPKMNIVLEMAHKLDDTNNQKQIPSKDRLVEKIIFNLQDVVLFEAKNVDLNYANKDLIKPIDYEPVGRVSKGRYVRYEGANPVAMETGLASYGLGRPRRGAGNSRSFPNSFTDSAISNKHNGQLGEKELQPWSGDDSEMLGSNIGGGISADNIENESANGWDANEMFKTNAEKFNINSSYDPSLSQYTTQLQPQDTKEYKKREAEAIKLANEIEKSDGYKARNDLENGDGDEEDKFSAVIRPGESRQNDSNSTSGKYVPPHQRRNPNQGRALRVSNSNNINSVPTSPQSPKSPAQVSEETSPEVKVNGEKEIAKSSSALEATSPEVKSNNVNSQENKEESASGDVPSTAPSKLDRKSSNPKTRDSQIAEFKEFSTNFKLSENETKEKKVEKAAESSQVAEKSMESVSSDPQREETVKKSQLNPNAKEFVFNPNAKPFQPKQPSNQISTPPRVHTQSPLNPFAAMQATHISLPPYMISAAAVPPQNVQQTQRMHTKRAIVSVQPQRPDFNPAAQAAAATGQPLLAQGSIASQPGQYPHVQYMQQPIVTPGGAIPSMYSQTMVQVPGPRMMTPQSVVPVNHVATHPGNEGGQQPSGQPPTPGAAGAPAGAVFVTPPPGATAVPAHMNPPVAGAAPHQQHPHAPVPAHMAPHHQPTPHSQPSHMTAQQTGHHTAPSPVHQHQHNAAPTHPAAPMQQQPPPPHPPPSSGTPQPQTAHIIYQPQGQMPPQGGSVAMPQHPPPLQPSPHTPTSPQTMQPPSMTFPAYHYNAHMQGMHPGQQQMAVAHSHPHPTTQGQQHAHSPQAQQIIMMQGLNQPGNPGGPGPAHHPQVPQSPQFQGHHMHGHAPGQTAHIVPHNANMAAISVSSASSSYPYVPHHPHQITFTVPSQGHLPPVQSLPYNQ